MDKLSPPAQCNTLGVIVLDESGSMKRFGSAPLRALERYVEGLRSSPNAASIGVSVVTFADKACVRVPLQPVLTAPLTIDWSPARHTRLYGTVHDVLQLLFSATAPAPQSPNAAPNVALAVLTDGGDNQSSERRRLALVSLATEARARGWELLTFGVGVDGRRIAEAMGFPTDSEHAFTEEAVNEAWGSSMSRSLHVTSGLAARSHVRRVPSSRP